MMYTRPVQPAIWRISSAFILLLCMIIHNVDATGYCTSYCDMEGRYFDSFYCNHNLYCCGTALYKFCCHNRSLDITGLYPEYYNCDADSWMQVHWQVMITMTGTVVLVLMFTACCCQCCRLCSERAREHEEHRVRYTPNNSVSGTIVTDADGNQMILDTVEGMAEGGDQNQAQIQFFNPESPYAFAPPDYNTVNNKEEPPKYNEVFGATGGANVNPCYVPDTPPPPFQEQVPGVHTSAHAPAEPIRNADGSQQGAEVRVADEAVMSAGSPAVGFVAVELSPAADDNRSSYEAPPPYEAPSTDDTIPQTAEPTNPTDVAHPPVTTDCDTSAASQT